MAISIDWATKIITVPQADLTFVQAGVYSMDVDWFRLELKKLEASVEGMAFDDTHRHNTEVTVGGVTLARVVEIINGYTVEFSPDSSYRVNLVGANTNLVDVGVLTLNSVQVIPSNSAGLIVAGVGSPAEVAAAVWGALLSAYSSGDTAGFSLRLIRQMTSGNVRISAVSADGGTITVYDTDNVTPLATFDVTNNQQDMERTS